MTAITDLIGQLAADPGGIVVAIAGDVGEPPAIVLPAFARHVELVTAVATALTGAASAMPATTAPGAPRTAAPPPATSRSAALPPATSRSAAPAPAVLGPAAAPAVHAVLVRLRADGAAAARDGLTLARLLDRHLSCGWALWAAAERSAGPRAAEDATTLALLGTTLLRAADLAAAAIAEGYGEVERERAMRDAAARRELVDALLEPAGVDPGRPARLAREAHAVGIDPAGPLAVVVAWLGEDVEDADPRVARIARATGRPGGRRAAGGTPDPLPVVATHRGRVVVLDRVSPPAGPRLTAALDEVAPGSWVAVAAEPVDRLVDLAGVAGDALAALAVGSRLPRIGRVMAVRELALERALLADETLLRAAVDAELGPLASAPRNGAELLETIEAFLAAGMSVTGAARGLHLAPRTVAYRLRRIEMIRGAPLDAAAWSRYAVLVLGRRLLGEPSRRPLPPDEPARRRR